MNTGAGPGAHRSRAPVAFPMRRVPCWAAERGVVPGPPPGEIRREVLVGLRHLPAPITQMSLVRRPSRSDSNTAHA